MARVFDDAKEFADAINEILGEEIEMFVLDYTKLGGYEALELDDGTEPGLVISVYLGYFIPKRDYGAYISKPLDEVNEIDVMEALDYHGLVDEVDSYDVRFFQDILSDYDIFVRCDREREVILDYERDGTDIGLRVIFGTNY